jgi:hypothetical protein
MSSSDSSWAPVTARLATAREGYTLAEGWASRIWPFVLSFSMSTPCVTEIAFMRDQLLFEVLLDIRDLFSVSPGDNTSKTTALEKLETLRRITKLR